MSLAMARARAFHVRAFLVALRVALGGIGLGAALWGQTEAHLARLTSLELAAVESDITAHLSARVDALVRMAGRHRQRPTPEAWREDAHYFIPHFPSFELIAWVDGAGSVRRATMSASSDDATLPPLDAGRVGAICERVRGQGSPVIGPAWRSDQSRWLGLVGVPAPTELDRLRPCPSTSPSA